MHLAGAVGFSLIGGVGFSVIGAVGFSLGFSLTGAVSSAERLISLTGGVKKLRGDVANIIPADHTLEDVFLILVSTVWFHSVCKLRMHNVQDTT